MFQIRFWPELPKDCLRLQAQRHPSRVLQGYECPSQRQATTTSITPYASVMSEDELANHLIYGTDEKSSLAQWSVKKVEDAPTKDNQQEDRREDLVK